MKTTAAIRLAAKRARRRRYGYAALRQLRQAVARALELRAIRSISPPSYAAESDLKVRYTYAWALRYLMRKWPALDLADPRSRP